MQNTVLILGANGRLGRASVAAFSQAGWKVLAQARKPLTTPASPTVTHLFLPLNKVAETVEAMGGANVIVNSLNPLYTEWDSEALPMAEAATLISLRLGATLIFPGNVYNFGQQMPRHLSEATPQYPTTSKGKIRCAIEADLQQKAQSGLRSIIVRAGDYIGEWNSGTWLDMAILKELAKGRVTYPGNMEIPHSWAYVPDLAQTIVKLAEIRQQLPNHSIYHFPGYTLTGNQLIAAVNLAATQIQLIPPGEKLKINQFPWLLIRLGGLFIPLWRELQKMRYLWDTPHSLNGEKLQKTLGKIPHTDLDIALENLLITAGFAPVNTTQQPI